jgi:hypothetical protein
VCSACETASFVRPRFFAGQLLTEDDLGMLIDYTVAKQRFHNARLFGEGVVCGLTVECGPCDSTQIVVQPGYALDCCGNDLVLTCQRTLDLAPMIRELSGRQKGRSDCTDPCPEPSAPAQQKQGQAEVASVKQYCLYIRYAERPDQPVSAYPVGDDCDAARCEPTRIVEGVSFELRCPPRAARASTMRERQAECKKALDPRRELEHLALAATRIASQRAVDLTATDPYRELRLLQPAIVQEAMRDKPPAELFEVQLQTLSTLAPLLSRPKLDKSELNSRDSWTELATEISLNLLNTNAAAGPTLLDRMYAKKLAEKWQAASDPGKRAPMDGVLWDKELSRASAEHLRITAAKLKQLGGCFGKVFADCELRELIDRLDPTWNPDEEQEREKASEQLAKAAEIVQRLLADCSCQAVNPPCPPCDDPGVLLACFQVVHCKVVRICNSERQYVRTPANQRYWDEGTPSLAWCCGNQEISVTPLPIEVPAQGRAPASPPELQRMDAMRRRAPLNERLALDLVAYDRTASLQEELAELRRRLDSHERKLNKERK